MFIMMIVMPKQMDQNDLRDNGQLDCHQNLSEYTSRLCLSYSIKIIIKYSLLRLIENFKEI